MRKLELAEGGIWSCEVLLHPTNVPGPMGSHPVTH
jgi:hypothetical protein